MEYVLFVCNHNAGRSQMAQAFFERLAPCDDVPVRSHILTLDHRQTRDCLRQERCEALAT
jgi:protein-tyrosine-phosphatase